MHRVFYQKPDQDSKYSIRVDYSPISRHLFVYLEDRDAKGLAMIIINDSGRPRVYLDTEETKNGGIICVAGLDDRLVVTPSKGVTVEDMNEKQYEFYDESRESFDGQELGMFIILIGLFALFLGVAVGLLL